VFAARCDFLAEGKIKEGLMRAIISNIFAAAALSLLVSGAFASDSEKQAADGLTQLTQNSSQVSSSRSVTPIPEPVVAQQQPELADPAAVGASTEPSCPVKNFGGVVEGVYRGGTISNEEKMKFIKDMGISVAVNMQWPIRDPQDLCDKYGIKCIYSGVPIFPGADLFFGMKELKQGFKIVLEELKAGNKVYIHCTFGRERTGILAAALQIREKMCASDRQSDPDFKVGVMKEVEAEFSKFGGRGKTYKKPYEAMKTWITDFEANKDWLCQ
jgi:hypothetical protein